jgi:serine/threonine protein kinase
VDTRTGAAFAVKTPRFDTPQHRAALRREAEVLEHLSHPGVVRFCGYSALDVPWCAMELLEGTSLRALVGWSRAYDGHGCMDLSRVVCIARRLGEALAHVHRVGFIHCDVKPENVFVCEGDRVVLLDFGAARRLDEAMSRCDEEWAAFGTWAYMAPECRVGAAYDHRADIYAFGCILTELLTGAATTERLPHEKWMNSPGTSNVPGALPELVETLTSFDPDRRMATLEDCDVMLAELEKVLTPDCAVPLPRDHVSEPPRSVLRKK